jgi:hypothetical protein
MKAKSGRLRRKAARILARKIGRKPSSDDSACGRDPRQANPSTRRKSRVCRRCRFGRRQNLAGGADPHAWSENRRTARNSGDPQEGNPSGSVAGRRSGPWTAAGGALHQESKTNTGGSAPREKTIGKRSGCRNPSSFGKPRRTAALRESQNRAAQKRRRGLEETRD